MISDLINISIVNTSGISSTAEAIRGREAPDYSFDRSVRKFELVIRDFGRMFDFVPSDAPTADWAIEREGALSAIIEDISIRYTNQKSDKQLAYALVNDFYNQLRYAYPYEQFNITVGEFPTMPRYGSDI